MLTVMCGEYGLNCGNIVVIIIARIFYLLQGVEFYKIELWNIRYIFDTALVQNYYSYESVKKQQQ